jgi:hypothetical protein
MKKSSSGRNDDRRRDPTGPETDLCAASLGRIVRNNYGVNFALGYHVAHSPEQCLCGQNILNMLYVL